MFRHSNEADLLLKMIPQDELEKVRLGEADAYTINTLAFRINWGYIMAGEIFDNPDVRAIMEAGLAAIRSVKARASRVGKYGATGEEFRSMGEALNWADDMQKSSTRREQQQCLDALYLINQHLKES